MDIPIPLSSRIRFLWQKFFRNEFLICSILFVGALAYAAGHQVWATWPEEFPYASILDDIADTLATGYAAAYIFYIFTVYLPRKRRQEEKLDLVAEHLAVMKRNVKNFYDAVGYKLSPEAWEYDEDFVLMYDEKRLHEKHFTFSLSKYPFDGFSGKVMPLNKFLKEYAQHAHHSIREIKRALPDESGTLRQTIDHCEAMCLQIIRGSASHGTYSLLMSNLLDLVHTFTEKYGPIE